jgi:hypothetical protein
MLEIEYSDDARDAWGKINLERSFRAPSPFPSFFSLLKPLPFLYTGEQCQLLTDIATREKTFVLFLSSIIFRSVSLSFFFFFFNNNVDLTVTQCSFRGL